MPGAKSQKDKGRSSHELKSSPYFSRSEASSRYFDSRSKSLRPSPFDLDTESSSENDEEGYEIPYNSYWAAVVHAVRSKPLLIQGLMSLPVGIHTNLRGDSARYLESPCLCNAIERNDWQTSYSSLPTINRTVAQPIKYGRRFNLDQVVAFAPLTLPDSASKVDLIEMLRPLGLYNTRAERLITMSKQYIGNPPSQSRLWESRVKGYIPTAVSHLVGCGRYALDSFRIFCCGDEWKSVMPWDKELIKYLKKWKWAVEAFRKWDPIRGAAGPCDEAYFWSFTGFSQY